MIEKPIVSDSLLLPGNRHRFTHVIHAQRDVMVGPWSMDLVHTMRRQRRFSKTMFDHVVSAGCSATDAAVTEALAQYPKFLAMAVARTASAFLVLTGPIDFAKHTHLLSPAAYAVHTGAIVGRVIARDDSDDEMSEALIADGSRAMPRV
ncbi:hypothetical protein AMAG_14509 [Allomyces macrogynus ATCC 38327]|uniref:Uncharacterized protein n=1 Tax=Allomyces macrogynus (strain ATCC 38327) TaxID=578462 RepID=A0A0L0T707_ALLM3|nr:hypothetical protein AMAG_14509 [Allomyces macrogynus ATCC 38327]|eukprot:KNE70369.1 hypothetical protein AMAG_14509 [Allomyces macrogynus ATCC 38327]